MLKDHGYATSYIGKWHLDASELNFFEQPESGADHWDAYTPEGERRQGFDYWYSYGAMDNHLDPHYWENTPEKVVPKLWSPEAETNVALDYLKNHNYDKPFCMFISWNPPHPPYDQVPKKYVDKISSIDFAPNVPQILKEDINYKKNRQRILRRYSRS